MQLRRNMEIIASINVPHSGHGSPCNVGAVAHAKEAIEGLQGCDTFNPSVMVGGWMRMFKLLLVSLVLRFFDQRVMRM